MIRNYVKVAVRNLVRNRMYSLINIGGLATGLACTILILVWVTDELSYDRFHRDLDAMYRVNWDFKMNNSEGVGSTTPPPLAKTLTSEIPEISEAVRVYSAPHTAVRYTEKSISESGILAADPNFFTFFDFPLAEGDAKSVLTEPNSIVLTEESARKYFGSEEALGKILIIGKDKKDLYGPYSSAFKVTGVVRTPPHNSHMQFNMVASMSSYPEVKWRDWSWFWMQITTYVKTRTRVAPAQVDAKIASLISHHAGGVFRRFGSDYDEIMKAGGHFDFVLQPLRDVYLGSVAIGNRLGPVGNRVYVYAFCVIAVFILFIACVNFMNLATARSARRAKEVGIRKTLGSQKGMLVSQFLVESVAVSALAMPIAIIMVELLIPPFNILSGKDLHFDLLEPVWLPAALLMLTVAVGVVAGSYPGLYLSSFKPILVLKGARVSGARGRRLRDLLVVFQFAITIGLIACTMLVRNQMEFVRNTDMGFTREGIVIISNENNRLGNEVTTFKQRLKGDSRILNASLSNGVPPNSAFQDGYTAQGRGDESFQLISYVADEDFIPTLGVKIIQGRNFDREYGSDSSSVILNEAAVKLFGFSEPLGKTIAYPGGGGAIYKIIGVMRDFNFMTLYSPITPFALFHTSSNTYEIPSSFILVRIPPTDMEKSIRLLESDWKAVAPGAPFEYIFLDESYAREYIAEQRMGKIFLIFSILTISIACIGLLGLAAFSTEQRTKEIGVRKVMGASVPGLAGLLAREFTKWVVLANLIAWPVAYYAMSRWLENFAYHVEIGFGIFIFAGFLGLLTALLTVSYQSVKAALLNPAEALRYE